MAKDVTPSRFWSEASGERVSRARFKDDAVDGGVTLEAGADMMSSERPARIAVAELPRLDLCENESTRGVGGVRMDDL